MLITMLMLIYTILSLFLQHFRSTICQFRILGTFFVSRDTSVRYMYTGTRSDQKKIDKAVAATVVIGIVRKLWNDTATKFIHRLTTEALHWSEVNRVHT